MLLQLFFLFLNFHIFAQWELLQVGLLDLLKQVK